MPAFPTPGFIPVKGNHSVRLVATNVENSGHMIFKVESAQYDVNPAGFERVPSFEIFLYVTV